MYVSKVIGTCSELQFITMSRLLRRSLEMMSVRVLMFSLQPVG